MVTEPSLWMRTSMSVWNSAYATSTPLAFTFFTKSRYSSFAPSGFSAAVKLGCLPLWDAGVSIGVVSKVLGHSRISTTADRYVRPFEDEKRTAAAVFAASVEPGKDVTRTHKKFQKTG